MASPKPFKIAVPDEQLEWIRDRVTTARIPPGKSLPPEELWKSWGLPPEYAQQLQKFWANEYDWRRVEREINNDLSQFTVPVNHNGEELTVHFVHNRSERQDAMPLLFLHGWPGSFLEVRPLIKHLTHPPSEDDPAFHVIAPSLPGYGFSSYPTTPCSPMDIAEICHKLMMSLDYTKYIVQGGDWGSMIGRMIPINHPQNCRAIHLNMVVAAPPSPLHHPLAFARLISAYTIGFGVNEYGQRMLKRMKWWMDNESGYSAIQGTKPQTLSYGLTDSPFGMMCWLREKVHFLVDDDFEWENEQVITWAMPYILNGSPGHGEVYKWSPTNGGDQSLLTELFYKIIGKDVAFGASIFPKDACYCPLWWAECRVAQNIVFWKEHQLGGHFPSVERPEVLAIDIRDFIKAIDPKILVELKKNQ